ncbi:MAG TPA: RsmB/NOP family class I SAM-dependent RNA methyltransferase, partial [Oceanipulchritudo sp.]|nr:RsmB/NOP family class I SAM-dependent RNA methyltransferase [Oceanipulchritudo sp.]
MQETVKQQLGGWGEAVELLCRWESGVAHMDDLLEKAELQGSRWLVMETFRQWLVIERILAPRLRKLPRPQALQILRLAVAECLQREPETHPRIVHHAVEVARQLGLSRPETGFLNAVLRGILRDGAGWGTVSLEATHPEWLVKRWSNQFGPEGVQGLLAWNQAVPDISLRAPACPEYAEATVWPGYFRIKSGRFKEALPDLRAGRAYVQDPFTRIPVELLAPQPGERVLDLCAAPGGKTRLLAEVMQGKGILVAVDRPGARLKRLVENAQRMPTELVRVLGCALEELDKDRLSPFIPDGLADAALIDVPCSNTGVIQKRPDVKIRLGEGDIARLALVQGSLLAAAARWVRPGGRLVYSTCSLEAEENDQVVAAFLAKHDDWQLETRLISLPWECGHDGGGAFL